MSPTKSEDAIGAKGRPFTGAEYLASLRDGREVYIYGERVDDVTTHPGVSQRRALDRPALRCAARCQDQGVLTSPTDTGSGGYTHKFFRAARSREELHGATRRHRRVGAHVLRLDGPLARLQGAFLMNTLGANHRVLWKVLRQRPAPGIGARRKYVLFMNHAIVNPPVDRAQASRPGQRRVHHHREGDRCRHHTSPAPRWWRRHRR